MTYRDETDEIFGRIDEHGHVRLHYVDDGAVVMALDENLYPILYTDDGEQTTSDLSARYQHPGGIVITRDQAAALLIELE